VATPQITWPSLSLISDASGNQHPAYYHAGHWNALGSIDLASAQVAADVAVAAGTTQPVISVDASFAGIGQTCEVTLSMPEVEFGASPGGECRFSLTLAATTYVLGHMNVKGPFAWPSRLVRQFPIPGAGTFTFAVSATSVSQPVTVHADSGASYGPVTLSVAVVA
jgi:hypothetical protein